MSCSADRQCKAKITSEGVFIEKLDTDPGRFLPEVTDADLDAEACGVSSTGKGAAVKIDLNRPMKEVLAELTKHPIKTRVSLTGTIIVARDIAHAKIKERLDAGEEMPWMFPAQLTANARQRSPPKASSSKPTTPIQAASYPMSPTLTSTLKRAAFPQPARARQWQSTSTAPCQKSWQNSPNTQLRPASP